MEVSITETGALPHKGVCGSFLFLSGMMWYTGHLNRLDKGF
jgi:hypothetical protein